MILFPLLAVYVGSRQGQAFQATARVLLSETAAQEAVTGQVVGNNDLRRRFLSNEISRARSDDVAAEVRSRLGLEDFERLPAGDIIASRDSDVLIFTFSGRSAADAADVANTWAEAYVAVAKADAEASIDAVLADLDERVADLQIQRATLRVGVEELERRLGVATDPDVRARLLDSIDQANAEIAGELNVIDSRIAAATDDITELQLTRELGTGNAELVRAAVPSGARSAAALVVRNLVIGLVLGTIIGLGLALLAENLSRRIRGPEDVERLGYNVLGVIPRAPGRQARSQDLARTVQTDPGSPLGDGFQKLRSAIHFRTETEDVRTILVTSPDHRAGKTAVACNLALAFATVESRVVLVDADLRNPDIHDLFEVPREPGLSDVLIDSAKLADVVHGHPWLSTAMVTIPAGTRPPSPSIVLSSASMGDLIGRLRVDADIVFFDSAPVLAAADAQSVASRMDGVVLVVRANTTSPHDLQQAADAITAAGGRLLGVVVNQGGDAGLANPLNLRRTDTAGSTPLAVPFDDGGFERAGGRATAGAEAGGAEVGSAKA
jgi:capsular exopolysaccharide synthesis family protein